MKLGDITFKQIAEICAFHMCGQCPFCNGDGGCILLEHVPSNQNLNMEINTDVETE